MPTLGELIAENQAKDAAMLADRQARYDAKRKEKRAAFESPCPQRLQKPAGCRQTNRIGDLIVQPGCNKGFAWYCEHCGNALHALHRPVLVKHGALVTQGMLESTHKHLAAGGGES